jgi:hypothetical protein
MVLGKMRYKAITVDKTLNLPPDEYGAIQLFCFAIRTATGLDLSKAFKLGKVPQGLDHHIWHYRKNDLLPMIVEADIDSLNAGDLFDEPSTPNEFQALRRANRIREQLNITPIELVNRLALWDEETLAKYVGKRNDYHILFNEWLKLLLPFFKEHSVGVYSKYLVGYKKWIASEREKLEQAKTNKALLASNAHDIGGEVGIEPTKTKQKEGNSMAKMIAKDALLALVQGLQDRKAELAKVDTDVEKAKATLADADAKREAAKAGVDTAYKAIVDEVGEELAKLFDAKESGKTAKASGGSRTRMTKEQAEKVKQAVISAVAGKTKTTAIPKSGIIELLTEQGLSLPSNPSYLGDLVKAKLISKSGDKASTVYYK